MIDGLTIRRAHQVEHCPAERRWLIEDLWADQAVGLLVGEPKAQQSGPRCQHRKRS